MIVRIRYAALHHIRTADSRVQRQTLWCSPRRWPLLTSQCDMSVPFADKDGRIPGEGASEASTILAAPGLSSPTEEVHDPPCSSTATRMIVTIPRVLIRVVGIDESLVLLEEPTGTTRRFLVLLTLLIDSRARLVCRPLRIFNR